MRLMESRGNIKAKICGEKLSIGDHPFSTYAKFSEKLTFLTP